MGFFLLQQYFQSGSATPGVKDKTLLTVEWTNQHGCGGSENTDPQKQNCHMVLQYMCQDDVSSPVGKLPWFLIISIDGYLHKVLK